MTNSILDIVGLRVVAIRGICTDNRVKTHSPKYILFSDKKTYIELDDQDVYSYHDCDYTAKRINVYRDDKFWARVLSDVATFPAANCDID